MSWCRAVVSSEDVRFGEGVYQRVTVVIDDALRRVVRDRACRGTIIYVPFHVDHALRKILQKGRQFLPEACQRRS